MIKEKLGNRKYKDTRMMAGYYSDHIHEGAMTMMLESVKDKNASIMDIGAGTGAFCRRMLDHGYSDLSAIEKYADFKVEEAKLFQFNLNIDWPIDDHFDVFIALEIIEHMENPWHFLRQIRAMAHEQSICIISTPNPINFIDRLKLFTTGKVEMMTHNDHRSPIFPEVMEMACKETGWKIVRHRCDIDVLAVPSLTLMGKMKKLGAKVIRYAFNGKELRQYNGFHNVWQLQPVQPERSWGDPLD